MTAHTKSRSVPGVFRPALTFFSLLVFLGPAWSGLAQPAKEKAPLVSHELLPGLKAKVLQNGDLVFLSANRSLALLQGQISSLSESRRSRDRKREVFAKHLSEGVKGGLRGFSSGADDDQDGIQDEDRRDGLDNDGDGLIDEDFAAIGDDMTVVRRSKGSATVHQESYHWSSPELRPAVFLSLASSQPDLTTWSLSASEACWVETDITGPRHTATGRVLRHSSHPFVTRVPDPAGKGQIWLAVMVLGDRPGFLALGDEGGCRLDFPLDETPLPLVLVAAPTWLQLVSSLTVADLVYRGVSDPLNNRAANWIVPAPCGKCRTAELPEFSYRLEETKDRSDLVLAMDLGTGQHSLLDPDAFGLGGQSLGPANEIVWRPRQGLVRRVGWMEIEPQRLRQGGGLPPHPWTAWG